MTREHYEHYQQDGRSRRGFRALSRTTVLVVGLAVGVAAMTLAPSVAQAQVEDDLKDGDVAYDRSDWRKAGAAYDRAIKKYPQQVSPGAYAKRASIWLILSSAAKKKGNVDLQKKLLEEGLKFLTQKAEAVHSGAAEVLEQKALMLWALKSKPDAIKIGEQVVAKKPSAFAIQQILGEFYQVREPGKAVKALKAYFKHRPKELEKADVLPRVYLGFALLNVAKRFRRTDEKKATAMASQAINEFKILLQKHKKRPHSVVNANNGLCAAYTFVKQYNRAITVCEKIIQNPRNIDRAGSVFFNLGQAYLENKQPSKARTVGREYVRLRKTEAKGYILIGDAFRLERNWTEALEQYQKAEEYAKNSSEYAADIGIKLGISYRRTKQLDLAIAKLESALDVDPSNTDLIRELGGAYIAAKRDKDALGRAEVLIGGKKFAELNEPARVEIHLLAAKSAYNLANQKDAKGKRKGKAKNARKHFDDAYALRKKDVQVLIGLVNTINLQAYRAFERKDAKGANRFLTEALSINSRSPLTNQNLAVLAIANGKCDRARTRLAALSKQRAFRLSYHRLMGRAYLCGSKRNVKSAAQHFAKAEKAASNDNLTRAEIYTEWAPLIWDKKLDRAVEMLESAVQYTAQNRKLARPAQRNLALALFRRGWRTMRKGGNKGQAAGDFARAARDPGLLKGNELAAFEFSEALARLERGDTGRAAKLFAKLSKGKQNYLKAPYSKVGAQFFGAYAQYRSNSTASQRKAITEFNKLTRGAKGRFGVKVRELLAASHHELASDAYRRGRSSAASKALATADKLASGTAKRTIQHNRAVVRMGSKFDKGALSSFSGMGSNPPQALANKGILLDRQGKPKQAYDAWVQARSKGARSKKLNDWINAKKRIFGY